MTAPRLKPATSLTAFGAAYFALVSGGMIHDPGGGRDGQLVIALVMAIPMLFCAVRLFCAPLTRPRWTTAAFSAVLALFLAGGPIALLGFDWTLPIYGTAFVACVYFAYRQVSGLRAGKAVRTLA